MSEQKTKPIYSILVSYPTKELEVTVHSNVAKAIIEGFATDQGSIRFFSVSEHFYVLDFRQVLYIRAKPWVVELEG